MRCWTRSCAGLDIQALPFKVSSCAAWRTDPESKTSIRKPLLAMIALGAVVAAPACAQQARQDVQGAAVQEQQSIQARSAGTTAAHPGASSGQGPQGWNDLDANRDGAISKSESGADPGPSQIFGQADGDRDGKLTQAECKAFVASHYGDGAGQSSGQ
jgi:hypothetical protein